MLVSLDAIKPIANRNLRSDLKLQEMIETHIVTIAQTSNEHSTMLKELRYLSLSAQARIIGLRDRYEALFRNVVKDCIGEGFFRSVDVKISTLALLGMMNWLIHWYSKDGKLTSEHIAQMFSDLFVNGPRRLGKESP